MMHASESYRETGDAGSWVLVIDEAQSIHRPDGVRPSDYERHTVTPGTYPITLVDKHHNEWGPDGCTPGYTRNIGPEFGLVTVPTQRTERYTVDRLGASTSATHDTEVVDSEVHGRLYSFSIKDGVEWLGGVIRRVA